MFYIGKEDVKTEESGSEINAGQLDWARRFEELASQTRHPQLKAYYEAGAVAANTPIHQVPMIAMDFETTGIDASRDDIVSIGLVAMTLERIRLRDARHWILKPRTDLREESVVIHGITHSEVEAAPDLKRILEELLEVMAGQVMVVHHKGIERNFLNAALKRRIGEGIEFPVIDTLELEARLHRRKKPGFIDKLFGREKVSIRLADSRARYHLPHYRPHDALTDALASAELLQAQVATRFSKNSPVADLWS
ncbi:3'-5' exonuclease [Marinobacterium lutimaris]|uniref:DNA polymerase-3 subunit epsilon n=1 Tax=Marinobacterium lutimaris TaxID=568106 RepID=A0A1H5TKK8_9GAMM|nr:3'-5' exonuclease [Marinobacterium lutimaris]SEF62547.1 DNA polymerase-3 subunit epsilon [Marinobacterium lutimaris]